MTAAGFTALATVDQNLAYQQNLLDAGVVVVVFMMFMLRSNRRADILPLRPNLRRQLPFARKGELLRLSV